MSSNAEIKGKFGFLRGLGNFISVLGWIMIVGGSFAILVGIGQSIERETSLISVGRGASVFLTGLFIFITGIFTLAYGESLKCFVSIENNTDRIEKALIRVLKASEKQSENSSNEN